MTQSLIPTNTSEVFSIAKVLFESGYFQDAKSAAQASVKVLAGAELGLPAFQSMNGMHIISGKPQLGAGLIASLIKRSGKYDYEIIVCDDKKCSIDVFENGKKKGNVTYTIEQARKAGVKNLEKFPDDMLYARTMSKIGRRFTPDIFGGPIYSEGEIEENQPVHETTAEVVHEAKVTQQPAKTTGKRASAQAMKEFQENGTMPEPAGNGDPVPDEQFVFDRIDEFTSNIQKAQDDPSWDWNEQMICEDTLIPNEEKVTLIKMSIIHRTGKVFDIPSAEVVKKRLGGFAKFLGPANTEALLLDLVEQAKANGMDYVDRKFVEYVEPTNEQLSQALADNV